MSDININNMEAVKETDYGVFVWTRSNGNPVGIGNDVMCIQAKRGDSAAVDKLKEAAKYYGVYEGGKAVFMEGARPVSEDEYQAQVQRLQAGLEPDPLSPVTAQRNARKLGIKFP